ncbi:RNA polymerase sigma factor [Ferruginibacter sp.]
MEQQELIPHLFRTEYRKITAVLCRLFGMEHIEMAEDIAGEAFLTALETWPYKGVPQNPTAWLYFVAKNKAKNYLQRHTNFKQHIAPQLKKEEETFIDLSEKNISDSQLQMLFAICHPAIPVESQIGLALRILCGFGIEEIANALLSNKETINKRLVRAREKLRTANIAIEFRGNDAINERLQTVLTTLYLLFNEGYYSESSEAVLREELCLEAMRLTYLLIENPSTNLPQVNALMALMCFHASRFEARKNENGAIILYNEQDESLWNQELISKGILLLKNASVGNTISKYHIEAGIAYWLTVKEDTEDKWQKTLQLYNQLLCMEYSHAASLNRTYAFSKVYGNTAAIAEAEKLQLNNDHFYFTLLGELYKDTDAQKAKINFEKALALASTSADKQTISNKIKALENFK